MGQNLPQKPAINSKYRDSVFSLLFGNPEKLRELYAALSGVNLAPDIEIEITTLQDVLFMEHLNDLSFLIGGKLIVLIEHQSTINFNMPLRLFLYAARTYEKIIDRSKLYHQGLVKIPEPEFIVLYNGTEELPDFSELKLSSAFLNSAELKSGRNSLELSVKVYNINHGRNAEILAKSETLTGYSRFVSLIQKYREELPLNEAMKAAIKLCIKQGILGEFLKTHRSEVINMLLEEWNFKDALKYGKEESREIGRAEGRKETAKRALAKGIPITTVQEITGLDIEIINSLNNQTHLI